LRLRTYPGNEKLFSINYPPLSFRYRGTSFRWCGTKVFREGIRWKLPGARIKVKVEDFKPATKNRTVY